MDRGGFIIVYTLAMLGTSTVHNNSHACKDVQNEVMYVYKGS